MISNLEKSKALENFDGIVLINKEKFMTSYDIIRYFKKFFF